MGIYRLQTRRLFIFLLLYVNVFIFTKGCICNSVMLQIQVQANKVVLEVAHMQEILEHWGNVLCIVFIFPLVPYASCDRSLPHGH